MEVVLSMGDPNQGWRLTSFGGMRGGDRDSASVEPLSSWHPSSTEVSLCTCLTSPPLRLTSVGKGWEWRSGAMMPAGLCEGDVKQGQGWTAVGRLGVVTEVGPP